MSEIYFEVKDDVVIKYTPMPGMGENFYEREVVMTKEIFRKCYEAWVDPQPKIGHWIKYGKLYQCSECKELFCCQGKFCNECGAKMFELQESEGKE